MKQNDESRRPKKEALRTGDILMKIIRLSFFVVLLAVGLVGCQEGETTEKITIIDLEKDLGKLELKDGKTMKSIEEAINTAKKVPGIVNMADPEYKLELGERTYFLWLDEKSGTIMDTVDTHTISTLSDHDVKQFYGLIQEWINQ